jgi:uncharacterized protein
MSNLSSDLIEKTAAFVRKKVAGDSSGHDWPHIDRVRLVALRLAREEGADLEAVELAALLHDVADWKFHGGDDTAGPRVAREWLLANGAEAGLIDRVCQIIAGVTYKGAGVETPMDSLEGRVVQDADRLDALGAIGVGRCFAYGGAKGREMYNPAVPPVLHGSFEQYKKNSGPTINHFYEKLLLLKDRLQTAAGRRLAEERHAFLEAFLAQFLAEWNGER